MNKISIILFLIIIANNVFSQDKSDKNNSSDSSTCVFVGSFDVTKTELIEQSALGNGLQLGVILDEQFIVHLRLNRFASNTVAKKYKIKDINPNLDAEYTGLFFGMYFGNISIFKLYAGFLVGYGEASFIDLHQEVHTRTITDYLLVCEPALGFNIKSFFRWLRFDFNIHYRIIAGVNLPTLSSGDLSGPGFCLSLNFGTF